ncbi:MAG: hypothetical protein US97_C0039G0006 [Microgenomates group bacterium GW2011_GWF1_38_5]|nr:MAG: hypothetical protein US97_C0039G0006 [Microgenomates group bacterium GW2011_GWF1_38_5]
MSKVPIHDKDIVFKEYVLKRNPTRLVLRRAQYEEALKLPNLGADKAKEFKERIALIDKALIKE